jgi:asparagine synthase (glutamine-hydrolysing)
VDLNTYLAGDILTKVDRTSMANSLEMRPPLLDPELVEWAGRLPVQLKLHRGDGKLVLKHAMAGRLPDEIIWRRKQGFAAGLRDQFRRGAARLAERLLGEAMLAHDLVEPAVVRKLIDDHAAARFDNSAALWLLLVFEGFLTTDGAAFAAPIASDMLEPAHR